MIPRLAARMKVELFRRYGIPPVLQEVISKAYVARFLPRAPVILECGAHVGWDTAEMANAWPHGTVYAFEPVPALFEQLVKRTRGQATVRCFQLAIAAEDGQKETHRALYSFLPATLSITPK